MDVCDPMCVTSSADAFGVERALALYSEKAENKSFLDSLRSLGMTPYSKACCPVFSFEVVTPSSEP